ncbi:MAG TPA: helix-turn-helix transcriptional regulator [Candidatus Jeotgalibaca merdavium]|uniref:Helix-turn-helix transcriptional regulator n=1 Tax=Candidatus Jeotgalibaca merdavium TaxID=2838627 RepID=A0A9D2I221_9LACT|nr:helix-turn-helix transcriptional regulator [Candidatus Jeotgalibaca merdavium]
MIKLGDIDLKQVGKRIFDIRKSLNQTQAEFGAFLGDVDRSLISKWEQGKNLPNRERIEEIAKLAGISTDELLYGSLKDFHYKIFNEYWNETDIPSYFREIGKDKMFSEYFKSANFSDPYNEHSIRIYIYAFFKELDDYHSPTDKAALNTLEADIFNSAIVLNETYKSSFIRNGTIQIAFKDGMNPEIYKELIRVLGEAQKKVVKIAEENDIELKNITMIDGYFYNFFGLDDDDYLDSF